MVLHVKHLSEYLTHNRSFVRGSSFIYYLFIYFLEGALLIVILILKTLILCSQT